MAVQDHVEFYATIRHMDDEQLFALFRAINSVQTLAIVSIAMGTLALREYVVHLGAEWRTWKLLFKRRVMPARVAIIATRYGYLGAFVCFIIFQFGKPSGDACKILSRSVYGLYVVLWSSAGSIFLMRLSIIYAREPKVMIFFTTLWLACMSLWIYVATLFTATPVPKPLQYPYSPVCSCGKVPELSAMAWAGSIVFDSSVFIATWIRFRSVAIAKEPAVQMRSRKWLFESSMYYFGASLMFNTTLMLSSLLVSDPILSNLGTGCAFAVHAITASRMVYEAKGWSREDTQDQDNMMLNTYNERKRNGQGGREDGVGMVSGIAYSVEETVVRSEGGATESALEARHGNGSFDIEASREQRRMRHFQRSSDNKHIEQHSSDGHATKDDDNDDDDDDVDRSSRRSIASMQGRLKGMRGKYFAPPSPSRNSSQRRTSITRRDGAAGDQQQNNAAIMATRHGRDASLLSSSTYTVAAPVAAYSGGEELHREPTYKESNGTLTETWDGAFSKDAVRGHATSGSGPFDPMAAIGQLNFSHRASNSTIPTDTSILAVQHMPATPHKTDPPSYSTENGTSP